MKLLVLTQKVDKKDPILGFFHKWIEEFAKRCENVIVICLQKGECDLPDNVKVFSLGKEGGISKFKYIKNFYKYIWCERKNYDTVFVHMNQEYVLIGWLFWRLMGKKIFLWRNHKKGNIFTRIAVALSSKVFYTSEFSFTARFENSIKMPVGVDINLFKAQDQKHEIQNRILSFGRVDPVKKIHILIDALELTGKLSLVDIYGEGQGEYYENIKKKIKIFNNVPNGKAPEIYKQYDIFVNMTQSGSFDKTIIEAMVSGLIPVVCNKSLAVVLPKELIFKEDDARDLAIKIEYALNISQEERGNLAGKFREWVEEKHSLDLLTEKLILIMK